MKARKSVSVRAIVLVLAAVLVFGCAVGGTLAYLLTSTGKVTNTFVAGEIGELELTETWNTDKDDDGEADSWSAIVVPGVDIAKDPKVTFSGNNVDAYVFLKVDAEGWTVSENEGVVTYYIDVDDKGKMSWTLVDGWTKLENVDGVYYRTVAADAAEQTWSVIKDNEITVSCEITEDNIKDYAQNLTFTAYAIQQDGFTDDDNGAAVAKAWAAAQPKTTN